MASIYEQAGTGFERRLLEVHGVSAATEVGVAELPLGLRIVGYRQDGHRGHLLLAGAELHVRVNGAPIVGGIRVLHDKDELAIGLTRMYFSAESTPIVTTYRHDGSPRRPRCPVCRAAIEDGESIVRCPGCDRIYHQITASGAGPAKPCWTYTPACRFCSHTTSLSGEPSWRPEEVDL